MKKLQLQLYASTGRCSLLAALQVENLLECELSGGKFEAEETTQRCVVRWIGDVIHYTGMGRKGINH